MTKKSTKPQLAGLTFASDIKNNLMAAGAIEDRAMKTWMLDKLGVTPKLVEAKRHSILSGTPGVGKSYGVMDTCMRNNVNHMFVSPGSTMINFVCELAYRVSLLQPGEQLVVILDDADDVVFQQEALNKWKIAWAKPDPTVGFVPYFAHTVSMSATIDRLEKTNPAIAQALKQYQPPGQIGVQIPTDQVRFVILCNRDLEDPKSFRGRMKSDVDALVSRLYYKRIEMTPETQWGWLAHVLSSTQPFRDYHLSDTQKVELLNWMYNNRDRLRDNSYRTVEELAAAMINTPNNYEDSWNENLKTRRD
jgi:hypothetical protein